MFLEVSGAAFGSAHLGTNSSAESTILELSRPGWLVRDMRRIGSDAGGIDVESALEEVDHR